MSFPDVIPEGRTSITDCDEWLDFCKRAKDDLSLIRDGEPALEWALDGFSYAEERYERIADRIELLFGPWQGWHIVEVGGGYGGQARVLMERHFCTYWIHDLPEPAELQRAYLRAEGHELWDRGVGNLFLSNYALSEGTREMQEHYLKLAAQHPRGCITWNGWSHDTFTRDEFAAHLPEYRWITETPHPHADRRNGCLIWGAN